MSNLARLQRQAITVVIPAYNGARFIREAIESVFQQTCPPREIIVVDDCSTDDTVAVAESLIADSPVPLRVIRLETNSGGPAHPINVGIGEARSELVAVLDQDDVLINESLASHCRLFERFPEINLSCLLPGNYQREGRQMVRSAVLEELTQLVGGPSGATFIEGEVLQKLLVNHKNFLVGFPAFVFRKSAWERIGGISARWKIAADLDFLFGLAGTGRVAIAAQVGYLRRVHDGNVCNDRSAMYYEVAQVTADAMTRFPKLKSDRQIVRDAGTKLSAIAFRLRQSGFYRASLRCHIDVIRTCGLNRRSAVEILKLFPHWALKRLGAIETPRAARPLVR